MYEHNDLCKRKNLQQKFMVVSFGIGQGRHCWWSKEEAKAEEENTTDRAPLYLYAIAWDSLVWILSWDWISEWQSDS